MTQQRTGRGVAAVISGAPSSGNFKEIPLSQLVPNTQQPRKEFDPAALTSLVESIKTVGVLQPVLVRQVKEDQYELIAGERRFRASQEVGLKTIPAIIRSVEAKDSLEQALAENLHRAQLNPLEEAAAYQSLIEDFGLSQEEVAKRVQKSRTAIANTVRLTNLPPPVQKLIIDGSLTAGHARALLALKTPAQQIAAANQAVKLGWSVRQLEELGQKTKRGRSTTQPASSSATLLELENLLSEHLSTRVKVQLGKKDKGKISVEFFGVEDLERIYKKIQGD